MRTQTLTFDQLVGGAKRFFGVSIAAYIKGDFDLVLVNAGVAVENLSKALLFSMDPSFLVELHAKQFDALLILAGHADKATKLRAPRTIGAKEAVARARQVVEIKTPKGPLDELIEIRDGALHTAFFGPTNVRELLTIALRYADEIFDALEELQVWGDDRWGEHIELVDTLVEQSWSDVQHEVNRKITAARQHLSEFMSRIPGEYEQAAVIEGRQAVLTHLVGSPLGRNETGLDIAGELVDCPVCNHPGALCTGVVHIDYELPEKLGSMDRMEEVISISDVYLEPRALVCRVCGVAFSGVDELRAVDVPERLNIEEYGPRFHTRPRDTLTTLGLAPETFS